MSSQICIAGIDDATKCPCIGSIFLAAVVADQDTIEQWKEQGVKDSKLIAPKKRDHLAAIIKETALDYAIIEITPNMIDDKSFNLNEWEMLVVLKLIKKIQRKQVPSEIYIDNWETTSQGFTRRLRSMLSVVNKSKRQEKNFFLTPKKLISLNYIAEHRADEKYTIVGAASILAKSSSDEQYRKYRRKYGDFGSGNPGDAKTRAFVWQHRHNPLPIIRTSWHTFKVLASLERIEDDPLRKGSLSI